MNGKTLGYYLVPNATGAGSGYMIRVVPNGVVYTDELVECLMAHISTAKSRAEMVWAELIRVEIEHVKRGETVDIGGIRLKGLITGLMPYEDSPFTVGEDEFLVAAYADAEFADARRWDR